MYYIWRVRWLIGWCWAWCWQNTNPNDGPKAARSAGSIPGGRSDPLSLSTAANICTCTESPSGAMTWCWFTHIWECIFCHYVSPGYIWLPFKNLPISVALVIQPQSRIVCRVCLERSVTAKHLWHNDMVLNSLTVFIYINFILSNLCILLWTIMSLSYQKLSGVDKALSDPTQQAPHMYKILKLVVDSFGLVSGLLTEGSILKDLGATSLIIEGKDDYQVAGTTTQLSMPLT